MLDDRWDPATPVGEVLAPFAKYLPPKLELAVEVYGGSGEVVGGGRSGH